MISRSSRNGALVLLGCALFAAGCDSGGVQPRPQTAQTSAESFEKFGNYELHFNAIRTDQLTPEVASNYAIQRSTNRVLLNVALLRRETDGAPLAPADGAVSVDAYNLNGQTKNLEMRRITEGTAIYYIGEVSISGNEILVFNIKVIPAGESQTLTAQFQREFFAG